MIIFRLLDKVRHNVSLQMVYVYHRYAKRTGKAFGKTNTDKQRTHQTRSTRIVRPFRLVRAFVGSGIEEDLLLAVIHLPLAKQCLQVIIEVGCIFLRGADDQVLSALLAELFLHGKCLGRTHEAGIYPMIGLRIHLKVQR